MTKYLTLEEFELNETYKPINLLERTHLFNGISDIIKNTSLIKGKNPPNKKLYDLFIDNTLNKGGAWSTEPDEESVLVYVFLESWSNLSKIKIDLKLAKSILSELQETAAWNFMGGQANKTKCDKNIEFTFTRCKKGYEFLFALFQYALDLARSYPMTFYKIVKNNFGEDIYNNLKFHNK